LEASPSKSDAIPTHPQNNTVLHNSLGEPDAHCRVTTAVRSPRPIADHLPIVFVDREIRVKEDPATSCDSERDVPKVNTPEYLDSEIDDWNWDELEASPSIGETIPT